MENYNELTILDVSVDAAADSTAMAGNSASGCGSGGNCGNSGSSSNGGGGGGCHIVLPN